jgi:uncharacterized repeat protein (TIGR02543 family)
VGATLPADGTKTGHVFAGWYANSGFTGSAVTHISATDTGNKTFYAKWALPTVSVTGVSLNTANLSLRVDATVPLTATVAPADATNKTVSWTSSNTAVATVSDAGLVTARTVGTATITVTADDGGRTATCAVTVWVPVAAVPAGNHNYIKIRTYTSADGVYYMDAVQYYDGLGRPSQTVEVGVTPSQSDLVALQTYDGFGREDKSYLPAVSAGKYGAFVTDFMTVSDNTYNNTAYNLTLPQTPIPIPIPYMSLLR